MSREPFTTPVEALHAIEKALQEPLFMGMPVGTTLNDLLVTQFLNGNRRWDWKSLAKDRLLYYYHRYHRKSPTHKVSRDYSNLAGRVCITWLAERFDLRNFVFPLIGAYGQEKVFVVGPKMSMAAQLPVGTEFVMWDELPAIPLPDWRREFDRCAPLWRRRLTEVLRDYKIPPYVIPGLMDALQLQTQRIMAWQLFIDQAKPCAIVTEYDRYTHSSCLILAARKHGIPSLTMIHGALDPYPSFGFVPLLADYACCWGERHRAQMIELGAAPPSLLVTGCQRLTRTLSADRREVRTRIGLDGDSPLVMLITNPIKPEHKRHFAAVFCAAMTGLGNVTAVVRLHPAERLQEYQELIDRFPAVSFLENGTWTQDESLTAADIVVNHESSFGNDALVKGRLVVILDVLAEQLKNGKELIDMAGCPCAQSADELRLLVGNILADEPRRNELHRKAEAYVKAYCAVFGQDAADSIVRHVNSIVLENAGKKS